MLDILHKKIILASRSPRRKALLEQAGFSQIIIRPTDVPEDYPADMPSREVAPYLAEKKATVAWMQSDKQDTILAADSVVILDDEIYEKPTGREDAQRILTALSGRVHTVITGVCLIAPQGKKVFFGESSVHFNQLSNEEIDHYIDRYQPYDKAGGYAIQEWIGLCKVDRIEGTYSNIMGLPMDLVYRELNALYD